ncbi:MAG TPA: hypothetical protein VNN17_04390, partial [Terriglobia bacterium]|nr:hypothetical protein [Terriglobia bacterium]
PQRGSPPADAPPPAKNPFVTKSPLEHPAKANGSSAAGEPLGVANPFPEPVPLSNYKAKPTFGFLGRLVGRRG